ncbi:triphosphoribosyl-dephospho-CoA synthase [Caloramator sp. CAR-1]|uniref:triphosphoribosyl-dephospho-CoA synthase n=1 Tax=Caloramator sp. CAR-1 TaxID=3062777 RepID=UPI0026E4101C|nr:triphosphoribosyl-dephospho-CoA synthase [Caloramator sp. CAR-1]MDO6355202.1 triphosphoribosyl-dephospho-CoA synthase [Caloramator sp. CAR-1]
MLKDMDFCNMVGQVILEGMLLEVISHPSPGLVSPFSKGSHSDMDYNTFLRSTAAIAKYLPDFVHVGLKYDENILERVRNIGLLAEEDMFRATYGINTQKGLIFLTGLIGASTGRCKKLNLSLNRLNIANIIKEITCGIVEKELKNINKDGRLTNGERLYLKYGVTGIRGEVEKGLPTVLKWGLPAFEDALRIGLSVNDALIHSLIYIISKLDDTTVLNRRGLKGLYFMKNIAKNAIFLGAMKTQIGREYVVYMDKIFKKKNISPGGAADLLAVTYIIYKLENWGN